VYIFAVLATDSMLGAKERTQVAWSLWWSSASSGSVNCEFRRQLGLGRGNIGRQTYVYCYDFRLENASTTAKNADSSATAGNQPLLEAMSYKYWLFDTFFRKLENTIEENELQNYKTQSCICLRLAVMSLCRCLHAAVVWMADSIFSGYNVCWGWVRIVRTICLVSCQPSSVDVACSSELWTADSPIQGCVTFTLGYELWI
jgi:hypothetical protein